MGGVGDEFTCYCCKEVFLRTRTDEDAKAESDRLFGEIEPDDLGIVCDDCFRARYGNIADEENAS